MKTFIISVADEVYQRASQKAAATATSVPEVVQEFLSAWTQDAHSVKAPTDDQRRDEFLRFLEELATRPVQPGPSVGPLNREELYQRGVPGY